MVSWTEELTIPLLRCLALLCYCTFVLWKISEYISDKGSQMVQGSPHLHILKIQATFKDILGAVKTFGIIAKLNQITAQSVRCIRTLIYVHEKGDLCNTMVQGVRKVSYKERFSGDVYEELHKGMRESSRLISRWMKTALQKTLQNQKENLLYKAYVKSAVNEVNRAKLKTVEKDSTCSVHSKASTIRCYNPVLFHHRGRRKENSKKCLEHFVWSSNAILSPWQWLNAFAKGFAWRALWNHQKCSNQTDMYMYKESATALDAWHEASELSAPSCETSVLAKSNPHMIWQIIARVNLHSSLQWPSWCRIAENGEQFGNKTNQINFHYRFAKVQPFIKILK